MLLPLAALTTLAATCAPGIDVKDLTALAQTESRFDTLAIGDNTDRRSYSPPTEADAATLVRKLLAEGHSLDVGLTQINTDNFQWLRLTPETAFDPCESLRAAKAHLQSFSVYNTGDKRRGFRNGYVQRILDARTVRTPLSPAASTHPSSQPQSPTDPPRPSSFVITANPRSSSFVIMEQNQ